MKKSGPGKRNSSPCPPLPYLPSECPLCLLGCGKDGTAFRSSRSSPPPLPKRAKRPEGPSPLPSGTGRPLKSRCHFNHDVLNFVFILRPETQLIALSGPCNTKTSGVWRSIAPLRIRARKPHAAHILFLSGAPALFSLWEPPFPFLSAPSCSAISSVHRHLASGSASLASGGTGKPTFPIYPNG